MLFSQEKLNVNQNKNNSEWYKLRQIQSIFIIPFWPFDLCRIFSTMALLKTTQLFAILSVFYLTAAIEDVSF